MSQKTQNGLGKGLSALLGGMDYMEEAEQGHVSTVRISRIEPNRMQPRKNFDKDGIEELTESIRQHGVITPLVLRKLSQDRFQIIAGERRWRAAHEAGLEELPAMVIEADDEKAYELALVENLQREDLNALEEAEGYQALTDIYGLTQEEAAEKVGKSRPAVANAMRLLQLPDEVKIMVKEGTLSAGHARTLLSIHDESKRIAAAHEMIIKEMNVRQAESFVKKAESDKKEPPSSGITVDYSSELAGRISNILGRKVKISDKKGSGKIILEYYSLDDLETLFMQLTGQEIREVADRGKE